MSNVGRVAAQAANTLTTPLNVEDVFSTYLYTGNGTSQTITNGIDLAGEGGLVWLKKRDTVTISLSHQLFDTERGAGLCLNTNTTTGSFSDSTLSGFNSNGFNLGFSVNTADYASWTFRKAPKFFDVVTYTGDGTSGRAISHNLGGDVGMIIVKRTNAAQSWHVLHKDTTLLFLDTTDAAYSEATTAGRFGDGTNMIRPTSTEFTVDTNLNGSGDTYVAYLFAHNDGDGDFGPNGDADIIKCGSYTGNSSGEYDDNGVEVNLGFEPQWILIKPASWSSGNWQIYDTMRGINARTLTTDRDNPTDAQLLPNLSNAETGFRGLRVTPTGFKLETDNYSVNGSVHEYIYIAIRRGPMAVPESATEVFDTTVYSSGSNPSFSADILVDLGIWTTKSGTNNYISSRLTQGRRMSTNSTSAEVDQSAHMFDYMNGWLDLGTLTSDYVSWMWKRAPGFFDVVAYTGDGVAGRTVSHNLGVAPEMMWVKNRNNTVGWQVYHKDTGNDSILSLNNTNAVFSPTSSWNYTNPSSTEFTVGAVGNTNANTYTYIAYLFASLDGVSKVGSYTGNGSTQNIDCGFTSGARFVMIKRTDGISNWAVLDTERGIVTGNDPFIGLNLDTAEFTSLDVVDPASSGFIVNDVGTYFNESGGTYIYYAIA